MHRPLRRAVASTRLAAAAGMAMILVAAPRAGADDKAPAGTVRPIRFQDEAARAALDAAGINTVGFEYAIPRGKVAVVSFVARDSEGLIEDLSKVVEIGGGDGEENRGTVRLTKINPAKSHEGDHGKVRWVINVGGMEQSAWDADRYDAAHAKLSWLDGKAVTIEETGKDHVLWQIKAFPDDVHDLRADSPTTFRYEIRFRMEAPDRPGNVFSYRRYGTEPGEK